MASEAAARPALAENARAAGYMMASMAGFACIDAFMKLVAGELPLFQAVFLRGLIATVLIAGLALSQPGDQDSWPGRRDRRLVALRSLAKIGGTACFLTALFHMPIANASAILQSVPLAVTLGVALFLGEPVGWRRYVAKVIGFLGVLIIVRPGSVDFNACALFAVAAIGFIVVRDLSTRRLTPDAPALAVVVLTSGALTVASGAAALATEWRPVGGGQLLRLAIAAACLLGGYIFGVMTVRIGEIGFVQPFCYTLLIWSGAARDR